MPSEPRRLNINLPDHVYAELKNLADRSGRNMTDVVRNAIGLAKVAMEEEGNNNKLAVTNSRGEVIKEIVLTK